MFTLFFKVADHKVKLGIEDKDIIIIWYELKANLETNYKVSFLRNLCMNKI